MRMRCKKEGRGVSRVQGCLPHLPRALPRAQGQWDTASFPSQGEAQVSPPAATSPAQLCPGTLFPWPPSIWFSPDPGICHKVSPTWALGTQLLT